MLRKNALHGVHTKRSQGSRTCDPPSGCQEMRLSSFRDPEQSGNGARPFRSLSLPAMHPGDLESNNNPFRRWPFITGRQTTEGSADFCSEGI